jgi:hypothetical protein
MHTTCQNICVNQWANLCSPLFQVTSLCISPISLCPTLLSYLRAKSCLHHFATTILQVIPICTTRATYRTRNDSIGLVHIDLYYYLECISHFFSYVSHTPYISILFQSLNFCNFAHPLALPHSQAKRRALTIRDTNRVDTGTWEKCVGSPCL